MLNIGDKVLYGAQGVCVYEGEETKTISGKSHTYIVLSSLSQNPNKIFVPKDNEKLCGKIQKILTVDEANDLIDRISSNDSKWIEDDAERREFFRKTLSCSDRMELVKMIKLLYRESKKRKAEGKKLHISDEQFFIRAKNLLHTEIGIALDISADDVEKYIDERINI
jgi:RNA polymerase-interacting CarD/CdnL/TRCF family regulator